VRRRRGDAGVRTGASGAGQHAATVIDDAGRGDDLGAGRILIVVPAGISSAASAWPRQPASRCFPAAVSAAARTAGQNEISSAKQSGARGQGLPHHPGRSDQREQRSSRVRARVRSEKPR